MLKQRGNRRPRERQRQHATRREVVSYVVGHTLCSVLGANTTEEVRRLVQNARRVLVMATAAACTPCLRH